MRILADENVDLPVVEALRQRGFAVEHVLEVSPGLRNGEVLAMALETGAVLLTADKEFGEMVRASALSGGPVPEGLVLLRLPGLSPAQKAALVAKLFTEQAAQIPGKLVVVSPKAIRIRPLRFP